MLNLEKQADITTNIVEKKENTFIKKNNKNIKMIISFLGFYLIGVSCLTLHKPKEKTFTQNDLQASIIKNFQDYNNIAIKYSNEKYVMFKMENMKLNQKTIRYIHYNTFYINNHGDYIFTGDLYSIHYTINQEMKEVDGQVISISKIKKDETSSPVTIKGNINFKLDNNISNLKYDYLKQEDGISYIQNNLDLSYVGASSIHFSNTQIDSNDNIENVKNGFYQMTKNMEYDYVGQSGFKNNYVEMFIDLFGSSIHEAKNEQSDENTYIVSYSVNKAILYFTLTVICVLAVIVIGIIILSIIG